MNDPVPVIVKPPDRTIVAVRPAEPTPVIVRPPRREIVAVLGSGTPGPPGPPAPLLEFIDGGPP